MTDISTTCAVVIFRVKVSRITSVDGTNLWLLTSVSVRHVLGRLSVKPWCYWLWRLVMSLVRFDRSIVTVKYSRLLLVKFSAVQHSVVVRLAWVRQYCEVVCSVPVTVDLDCEQSLIFLCKVTARKNPSMPPAAKPRAPIKEGVSPRRKNKRLLTLLFCLGTTKLSSLTRNTCIAETLEARDGEAHKMSGMEAGRESE